MARGIGFLLVWYRKMDSTEYADFNIQLLGFIFVSYVGLQWLFIGFNGKMRISCYYSISTITLDILNYIFSIVSIQYWQNISLMNIGKNIKFFSYSFQNYHSLIFRLSGCLREGKVRGQREINKDFETLWQNYRVLTSSIIWEVLQKSQSTFNE